MSNKNIPSPPNRANIAGENTPSSLWASWFSDIHRRISSASYQTITAAEPVNLDSMYCSVGTTTGTYAITLDAPTIPGIPLVIEMIQRTSTYNVTLSLTNVVGASAATTCTFNSVRDTLVLVSLADKWLVIKEYGVTVT